MRRQETQSIADILREVLKENHIDTHLYEMQIVEAWYKLLGSTMKKYTTNIYVRERKLCVKLSSPVLKSELLMARSRMVESLNKEVHKEVITDIIFL
ncbi:MAG: DUF721 domain-containing protein [Paludibacteraceae bacterium]|nr:DUF721 domain-containing protein [Paludibacteraceae bacterium]MBR4840557.1 DUF721 domain-containing protein [Paludibacteraceae bacterium]